MILGFLAAGGAVFGEAAESNRYDLLAKSIGPFIALGTPDGSDGNHAIDWEAVLVKSTGLPVELNGARVRIVFEFPDKLRVDFPVGQTQAIVCRNGQEVWATPATLFTPLVDRIGSKPSGRLPEFRINPDEAVLLPALFQVKDKGNAAVDGQDYRVLDVGLIPEIAHGSMASWSARLWIRPADRQLAQITLHTPDWSATLRVEKEEFSQSLAPETWNPTQEQAPKVLTVPGDKIARLIQLAAKQAK